MVRREQPLAGDATRFAKSRRKICASEERPSCPWCDSGDVRPILYGAPSEAMWQACANSHAVWGGCLVDGHEPQWACGSCHRNWGARGKALPYYCNLCGRPSGQVCAQNVAPVTKRNQHSFFSRLSTNSSAKRLSARSSAKCCLGCSLS